MEKTIIATFVDTTNHGILLEKFGFWETSQSNN